ncbi:Hypothetical protein R9X50_00550000 [Acrodontium crateriforme]|uniref:BZIP domain-containing protein n=1 Tax=Acrodontium crateriforme TaxID=150365 RepID=A0AAQ3M7A2_9PEZI|nr:Hypothetical protein R9X50_00550000 [Acrodontium crateriforme]
MAASQSRSYSHINSQLSRDQQNLLLAALNAQAGDGHSQHQSAGTSEHHDSSTLQSVAMNVSDQSNLFISPQSAELDNFNDFTPDLDYLDGDNSFDFDNADLGGEMIGALPGSGRESPEEEASKGELHDKRKSPGDSQDGEEGDAKRQEGEKGNKKPGRKPLTSEPTTKRKAQNRAAQRAFRERKEKHLKDLETKVTELTKSQEADKHEKGLLKAQVERLQIELKEYRKRLSLGGTATRSPPLNATQQHRSNSSGDNFQFDFPTFGGLPNSSLMFGQTTPPTTTHSPSNHSQSGTASRHNSAAPSLSPAVNSGNGSNMASPEDAFPSVGYSTNNNMHGFASTLPQMNNDPFSDLFSPSILKNSSEINGNYFASGQNNNNANNFATTDGGDSTAGLSRVFQFNSGSNASDSASPSNSSSSLWNVNTANSSCGTSPESSHGSPANKDKATESLSNQQTTFTNQSASTNNNKFGNGEFNAVSSNTFDPVLFGDYRDNSDILGGNTAFTGGFFDEALNSGPYDFGSPSNLFGILQSPQTSNATLQTGSSGAANAPTPSRYLMAEVEKARDGGDDDVGLTTKPAQEPKKMINCNNIWNQLQANPEFQEGKFDLDSLCSELKAKARCSESGVMVDQHYVNAALKKLSKKPENGTAPTDMPPLMFEQDSWDKVLKKMGGNTKI